MTDADDLCLPDQLEKQYRFMKENPEFRLTGGAYKTLGGNQTFYREWENGIMRLLKLNDYP